MASVIVRRGTDDCSIDPFATTMTINNLRNSPRATPAPRPRLHFPFLVKAFVALIGISAMAMSMLVADDDTPAPAGQQHWQRDN